MNRLLKAGTAALLAITLAIPAVAFAKMAINMDVSAGPIVFPHERHANVFCITCHSEIPSATPPSAPLELNYVPLSCQACHLPSDGQDQEPAACIDCHNSVAPEA